jgi:hypothetical protein
LRMLSYYITWHLQARLAPLLFADDDKATAEAARFAGQTGPRPDPTPASPPDRGSRAGALSTSSLPIPRA